MLPYLFYTKGLEGVESGRAAIIANVEPVVAALNAPAITMAANIPILFILIDHWLSFPSPGRS